MRLRTFTPLVTLFLALGSIPTVGAAQIPGDLARDILIHEQARNHADGFLAELTRHESPAVRSRAFLALGRIQDVSLLPVLSAGLDDDDTNVRADAAFALGQLFSEDVETLLRSTMDRESNPAVQSRLVEALGKCGSGASVSYLSDLVKGGESPLAEEAALALGVLGQRGHDLEPAKRVLEQAMASTNPELSWRAAFAAFRGGLTEIPNGVIGGLKSPDAQTVIYTLRAAGNTAGRPMGNRVVPSLDHTDWRVRVEALKALLATKSHFRVSQASILLEDPNPNVRLTALDLMGTLGRGDGITRIKQYRQSSDWRLRAGYLKAMAASSGEGSLNDLRDAMKDDNWRVRQAAAEAFGILKSEQALLYIETYLHDESPQVQSAMISSLQDFPQRYAVELIRGFLKTSDVAVLTMAATASGQRYDLGAVPQLVAAYDPLQSPVDTEVMVAILEALGQILSATEEEDPVGTVSTGDRKRGEALLEAALHDRDMNVAQTAADALTFIRGREVPLPDVPRTPEKSSVDLDLALALQQGKDAPTATLVTNRGEVVLRLLGTEAPGTVANFVTLAREGYYNGLTFHRVVADFVVQAGDPRGDGWGGPGYAIPCEVNSRRYDRGMVGMALSGKDTGGSQFFITHSSQPHLNGRYTIFGEVVKGMDVVDTIQIGDLINEVRLEGI